MIVIVIKDELIEYVGRKPTRSLTNLGAGCIAPLSLSPPLIVVIVPLFSFAQGPGLSLVRRHGCATVTTLLMFSVVASFEHLVDLLLRFVNLPHWIGRIAAIAVSIARGTAIPEVPSVAEITEALLMKESTTTITATATTTAIVKATATIAETIIVLIVVEAVSILEIVATATMIRIVEALEAWLVVRATVVVRSKLSLAVVTPIARPTATATSTV